MTAPGEGGMSGLTLLREVLFATLVASLTGAASAAMLGEPSGTGPLPATAESVPDLPGHTLYRPVRWPRAPMPLFVWCRGSA